MFYTRRQVQSTGGCLKNRFGNVVLIAAIQAFNVEIESPFLDEGFEKFLDQFRLKVADSCGPEIHLVYEIRTSGQVDDYTSQRLIQRNICMRKSRDSAAVPTSLQ